MKNLIVTFLILIATPNLALSKSLKDIELRAGNFSSDSDNSVQVIAITNHRKAAIPWIDVECGFYRGNALVASETSFIENLDPDETGTTNVISTRAGNSDRAECRLVKIRQ